MSDAQEESGCEKIHPFMCVENGELMDGSDCLRLEMSKPSPRQAVVTKLMIEATVLGFLDYHSGYACLIHGS